MFFINQLGKTDTFDLMQIYHDKFDKVGSKQNFPFQITLLNYIKFPYNLVQDYQKFHMYPYRHPLTITIYFQIYRVGQRHLVQDTRPAPEGAEEPAQPTQK